MEEEGEGFEEGGGDSGRGHLFSVGYVVVLELIDVPCSGGIFFFAWHQKG